MIRRASTYLLIPVLLGCPLICLLEASADVPAEDECIDSCCTSRPPAENCPDDSDSDRQPKSCLCGGAVMPGLSPKVTLSEEPAPALGGVVVFEGSSTAPIMNGRAAAGSSRFPPIFWGRQFLALIERLQL